MCPLVCSSVYISVCTAWCSEIGSLTSLDACNSSPSSDVREPISLHQAIWLTFVEIFFFRDRTLCAQDVLRKTFTAQQSNSTNVKVLKKKTLTPLFCSTLCWAEFHHHEVPWLALLLRTRISFISRGTVCVTDSVLNRKRRPFLRLHCCLSRFVSRLVMPTLTLLGWCPGSLSSRRINGSSRNGVSVLALPISYLFFFFGFVCVWCMCGNCKVDAQKIEGEKLVVDKCNSGVSGSCEHVCVCVCVCVGRRQFALSRWKRVSKQMQWSSLPFPGVFHYNRRFAKLLSGFVRGHRGRC